MVNFSVFVWLVVLGFLLSSGSWAFIILQHGDGIKASVIYQTMAGIALDDCGEMIDPEPGCSEAKSKTVETDIYVGRVNNLLGVSSGYAAAEGIKRVTVQLERLHRTQAKNSNAIKLIGDLESTQNLLLKIDERVWAQLRDLQSEAFVDMRVDPVLFMALIMAFERVWYDGEGLLWKLEPASNWWRSRHLCNEPFTLSSETNYWTSQKTIKPISEVGFGGEITRVWLEGESYSGKYHMGKVMNFKDKEVREVYLDHEPINIFPVLCVMPFNPTGW